ncbi:uncharacterized protein LOC102617766 isoform X2 [Citrus sinensis]|uniref:uncharacterized protein LOC102617766 isoform X2 n=1 Tax=Citrus sinensis TaxID=2711 RepID=UPI002277FCA0|nr:uncharacterized protein LOC102617766 isoform X2 [Citrus sinensis]
MMNGKMNGFNVEEYEEAAGKRQKGDSWSRTHVHAQAQHRRSKSAAERNSDISRRGISNSVKKELNEIYASPLSTRAFRAQTPLYDHLSCNNQNSSLNHRASLEKDIEQLQSRLQEERNMRMTLERAMGRVSSTLSPGHRHFASKTKELIAEIELLEEEVANREKHVLSLYRSIFEQCGSRPPSEQSSSVASPAHTKHIPKRHPSIISSAFCSSKKFPLRPLQALVSINDYGKRSSKTSDAPQLCGKSDMHSEKIFLDPVKGPNKIPDMEKASMLRTLKDHLNQCPIKLSEEMVRCMAAVYCWLCGAASTNPGRNRSPLLSRSSTNVVLPRHGVGEECDWSCKSTVEISWIATDKSQFSRASYAINNYRVLVEQLERVTVNQMESNTQTAFWINVYNALVMHAYLAYGIPNSSLRRLALFHKAAYNIGGHIISANAIEQSIFRFHTPRIGRLKVYTASNVKEELEVAKREFLQANVVVKKSRKVFLPKLLERFAKEAMVTSDDLLKWVTENVDKKLQDSMQKCIDRKSNRKASQVIEWLPYSSRFRYVFSKELMEKPWCGCEFLSSCLPSGGFSMSLAQAIKHC